MNTIIPLTKIGFFNPGRLTDEEIEQSFIARLPFFEFVFKKVIAEKPCSIPQHYLIIGQRGMGKTSLLIRIAAELRKAPYNNSFIPLSFPEEQYNVDRLSKFWLNCLDALADALDKEHQTEILKGLDTEISSLSKEKALDANTVYKTFEKWIVKINRRPVLLVDNLNLILSKTNKEEQHQLRAILMSEGAPILVGASATTIEETVDYGAPFYDAFQINYLKKLSFQESLDILLNLAKITGIPDFANHLYSKKGRVEALYQLTGGTPRTVAILFPLIQNGFSEAIQTDLDALLDVVTPLYKTRFEELAQQLQVVLDAVALHWDPINLEQLREVTLLENQQLSPQLKRLVDVGWLQKLDAYNAKGAAYELSERFFNIWYLMRRSSRRQKRELYCLTKFLESFYGTDLLEIAKSRLGYKAETINAIALDLALADALKDGELQEKLKTKSYDAILLSSLDEEIINRFSIPNNYKIPKLRELSLEGYSKLKEKKFEEAANSLEKAVRIDKSSIDLWFNLGFTYMKSKRIQEAEQAYKKVLELDNDNAMAWNALGVLYTDYLSKYKEAEEAFNKVIELGNQVPYTWLNLGVLYINTKRYKEAEEAYLKATRVNKKSADVWIRLGNLYIDYLGKYEEAGQAYKKAIGLNPKSASAWNGIGHYYFTIGLNREAEQSYRKAVEIENDYINAWNGLGNVYLKIDHYQEAEKAYKQVIAIDNKAAFAWSNLGMLYRNTNQSLEAIQAFKKSIELDKNFAFPWNDLGNLYFDFLHDYSEAEKAFLKSIELDQHFKYPKYNLIFLWRDKLNKIQEAKDLLNSIKSPDELIDSHILNKALFAYYDKNIGIAEDLLKQALLSVRETLPANTTDDWYRSAAVIIKLEYANSLLKVFSENRYDTIFRPLYVAIEAIVKKDDLYFNSIAAEVREPAKKIMERIVAYMK